MGSILKRKRGTIDAQDASKRAKSIKDPNGNAIPKFGNVGWDAAFGTIGQAKELVLNDTTNGTSNGHHIKGSSPKAIELDFMGEEDWWEAEADVAEAIATVGADLQSKSETWKLSEAIGGRMLNNEPVFSADEKHLIVASYTAIRVYNTSTSLLTRSIPLKIGDERADYRITTYSLSPTEPNILWVACADGYIYKIDWTMGSGNDQTWRTSSTGCIDMCVASMESAGRRRDVLFTTEERKATEERPEKGWRVTANELTSSDSLIKTAGRTIYTSTKPIKLLKSTKEGTVLAGVSGNSIVLGLLRSTEYDTIDKIRYEFRIFESTTVISSLDLRLPVVNEPKSTKKSGRIIPSVDLVVGDVRGAIFVHTNLLENLIRSHQGKPQNIIPRKLHWHRQKVNSVKWSLDGNYIISGGTETVLTLFQLDTGKLQFLPHLAATIQNIVVSPSGTSYAIQLGDNSAIVISTADLKASTSIAGIQANVLEAERFQDSDVLRVREESWKSPLVQRTVAVINPANPSQFLLTVGETQAINQSEPLIMGSPFLQTFDLGLGANVSCQTLTRANTTNINVTPAAHRLIEPRITHMKISTDGNWLATVDEWYPPLGDVAYLGSENKAERLSRREVFLKFWQRNHEDQTWELVSRIDKPHTLSPNSSYAGRVLDLAVDPGSHRFSTIGEDGVVCIWATKTRKRDGMVVRGQGGKVIRNWNCHYAVSLGKLELSDEPGRVDASTACGSVTFSEDGSVLAAACGNNDGLVDLIDPNSGTIRRTQSGLFKGHLMNLEFLGQDLITLSDELITYDLVSDEIRLRMRLAKRIVHLSTLQKQEMVHMAVDRKSQTFAIALPIRNIPYAAKSLQHRKSELFVFHQNELRPQLRDIFPSVITALLPAEDCDGYIVLDTAAEIRTVHKQGSQIVTRLAQSTSALQLDASTSSGVVVPLFEDDEEIEGVELPTLAVTHDENDDDDNETPVTTQQQLAEVFDIGPSFALPPLEEMFYQIAGLFSSKPLAQTV